LDYENAFDGVRSLWLFRILHERNILNPLLTAIINIYDNNEIKIKVDATLIETIKISKGDQQGQLYLTYVYIILLQNGKTRRLGMKISRNKNSFVCEQPSSSGGFRRCTTNFYT